jgi:hypothetical protein
MRRRAPGATRRRLKQILPSHPLPSAPETAPPPVRRRGARNPSIASSVLTRSASSRGILHPARPSLFSRQARARSVRRRWTALHYLLERHACAGYPCRRRCAGPDVSPGAWLPRPSRSTTPTTANRAAPRWMGREMAARGKRALTSSAFPRLSPCIQGTLTCI